MKTNKIEITIMVTRYAEPIEIVKSCLDSLSLQENCKSLVMFLDQQESPETKKYVEGLKSKRTNFKYIKIPAISLQFARNYVLKNANTNLVAFTDVDCILEKNWCREIVDTFKLTKAVIVGTKILPVWKGKKRWYHDSKYIQEFYSMLDVFSERTEIPKIIGASFACDKTKLGKNNYFDERLDRQNGKLLGGGETDFCFRIQNNGGKIIYTPFTTAYHQVEPERMNLKWLTRRAYYGGLSRALRGGKSQPFNSQLKFIDKMSLMLIFTPYVLGYLKGKQLK